jgi:DNA mismatch repair ATPase MutS
LWVARSLAVLAIVTVTAWYITGLATPFLLVLLADILLAYGFKSQLSQSIRASETTFANLDLLASFLSRLEREPFAASYLVALKQALTTHTLAASSAIADLRAIVQRIESRRNAFMAILDIPLTISLRAAIASETWRRNHGHAVASWLSVVGAFEALASIGTYSFEHPDDPFPTFDESSTGLDASGITHPLLARKKAVRNDVAIKGDTRVLLISGSNMSGKSTLLRSIGINVVLAMAGAPVRARSLTMSALQIGASIRVNDSLHEGSSRFYAEITRLKQIYELSHQQPPLLFLLDELLQGTNSADRRVGAQGVVRALMSKGAIGLVSTHDLALTDLSAQDDLRIVNVHFQDEIVNGKMQFDFRLQPGVVTKSNALELMRAIGLEV